MTDIIQALSNLEKEINKLENRIKLRADLIEFGSHADPSDIEAVLNLYEALNKYIGISELISVKNYLHISEKTALYKQIIKSSREILVKPYYKINR